MFKESQSKLTANNDFIELQAGHSVIIDVLSNDQHDNKAGIRIVKFSQPKHGTLSLQDSSFKYTAQADYHGKDYFFYSIADNAGNSATAHVAIQIIGNIQPQKTPIAEPPPTQPEQQTSASPPTLPKTSQTSFPTSTASRKNIAFNASTSSMSPATQPTVNTSSRTIQNPYYPKRLWKLWFEDPSSVNGHKATSPVNRVFPAPANNKNSFLNYSIRGDSQRYAGFWDDFYLNQDSGHSHIAKAWSDKKGNKINNLDKKFMQAESGYFDASKIKDWGVNFTNQSTTDMGHAISNRLTRMRETEIFYYFSDALRLGPAHVSYNDKNPRHSEDLFEALTPIMLNSYGASGSEMNAITKMLLAGGYLPKEVKYRLKRNGLYPSALLYIWKAALPYAVPYDNELRHRVAYLTNPNKVHSWYKSKNLYDLKYNEAQHLKNMLQIAQNMTVAPPVAILKKIDRNGGKVVYDQLKTTWLIHQNKQAVDLTVSTADSFDLQNLPLTYKWTVLYGNKQTRITPISATEFKIHVPYDAKLPKGRTAIMLTVNNGHYDSNPAIINIYRNSGKTNVRPSLTGFKNTVARPGETVQFNIQSIDPEGYPTTLYQWANQFGNLSGNVFTWKVPDNATAGKHKVTIISSDGSTGNSYQSKQISIEVKP